MKLIVLLIKNFLRQHAKLCPIFKTFKKIEVYSGSMSYRSSANRNFYKKALIYETDKFVYLTSTHSPQAQISRLIRCSKLRLKECICL